MNFKDALEIFSRNDSVLNSFQQLGDLLVVNPFLFSLFIVVLLDIVTGLGATFIQKNGLDSSIAFKGWVKHGVVLVSCFLIEIASNVIGLPVIGNFITFLGCLVYLTSIPGNLHAMNIYLPDWVKRVFKTELERKSKKYTE